MTKSFSHPSKRQVNLGKIRISGYHGRGDWVAPMIEGRISIEAKNKAYQEGYQAKEKGVICTCDECKRCPKVKKLGAGPCADCGYYSTEVYEFAGASSKCEPCLVKRIGSRKNWRFFAVTT